MKKTFAIALISTAFAALVGSMAEAADLRSWDQKLGPGSRFVVLSKFNNEAVLDQETQLVWAREPVGAAVYTSVYLTCLNSVVGGRTGWRVPTIYELRSLLGTDLTVAFPNLTGYPYWTQSPAYGSPGSTDLMVSHLYDAPAFVEHLQDNHIYRALCVRGHSAQP